MPLLTDFHEGNEDYVADVLAPNLRVVFCGTALGHRSAQERAYYAHPQNQFWKALHHIGLTPHPIMPKDFAQCLHYGIGLTAIYAKMNMVMIMS